jgi:hypothetical protein
MRDATGAFKLFDGRASRDVRVNVQLEHIGGTARQKLTQALCEEGCMKRQRINVTEGGSSRTFEVAFFWRAMPKESPPVRHGGMVGHVYAEFQAKTETTSFHVVDEVRELASAYMFKVIEEAEALLKMQRAINKEH